jgi:hypothetical protein
MPNFHRPWAYVIEEDSRVDGQYVPIAVFEDDPGRYDLMGNGHTRRPWLWGSTLDEAWGIADSVNAERGVTRAEALRIRGTSIAASLRNG